MTRVLSELFGAREPLAFQRGLARLEAASGHGSTDIRLTTEVERATKLKLRELGLDPHDTTGEELYAALMQRVKLDDERLSATLRQKYGSGDTIASYVGKALTDLPIPKSCFALKTATGKRLLKKLPPKHTMKALGYRSYDSMIRREPLLPVFACAWLVESATWRRQMIDAYRKLHAADFEMRQLAVIAPVSRHGQVLAETVVGHKRHNVIGLKEFGAVVVLPFPASQPPAATFTTLLVALHELNEVRASSTYLKLCQVRPDFGACVQTAIADEPMLSSGLLDGAVPWQVIQRYYARFSDRFRPDLFEPHIQKEDLSWHSIEKALSFIDPTLSFWHHTGSLALSADHEPVSLNVVDAALNYCNQLPYAGRIVHYFRHSLWHELMIRYLKHDAIEQTVVSSLESSLVPEPVEAEVPEI